MHAMYPFWTYMKAAIGGNAPNQKQQGPRCRRVTAVDWHQSKTANDGESQSKGCTPPVSFSPSYSVFWPEKVDELDPGSRASLRWTRALISERGEASIRSLEPGV